MRTKLTVILALCFGATGTAAAGDRLEQPREAFREAYAQAELGNWDAAASYAGLLEGYVLWPDLRAAWLRANLSRLPARDITQFLERFGTLKPARELRYRYALQLASSGRWAAFLDLYETWYQGLAVARLDCLAVHARILGGRAKRVTNRATALWLVDHSQAEECDPVFEYLRGAGRLGEDLYRQRFEMALAARQYSLARYLARSLDTAALEEAERWLAAHGDPAGFLAKEGEFEDGTAHRRRVVAAVERVALTDARLADEYWQAIRLRRAFTPAEQVELSRHLALWYARQHEPDAMQRLSALTEDATDDEVRRWRARAALARQAWPAVITAIDAMPADQRDAEEWRYWRAIAALHTDDPETAGPLLDTLSAERSYYGFLAADELDRDYAFAHNTGVRDTAVMRHLERQPAFIRARELFYVGLESRGRSEWDDAVALLNDQEKFQAALLAHSWGWHSRAIATAATAGRFDDLEIRYPLPYADEFSAYSVAASIPNSWAYGVARSESLFIPDIRSRAGAIGIMQLMPATGRQTAGQLNIPYRGLPTLTDPDSNIRLGTTYLGKMLQRFGHNRVVATAAYNAGPARVEQWLPESEDLDARIWIENIPFNETREYVRRVLVSDTIFGWRLTGRTHRLSASFDPVAPEAVRVAGYSARRRFAECNALQSCR